MGIAQVPANVEAERALLGALLVNNAALEEVRELVAPEHFYEPVHGRIYDAVCAHIDQGRRASPITLKAFFDNDAALSEVGGAEYVLRLASNAVSTIPAVAADYAKVIAESFGRRQIMDACSSIAAKAGLPAVGQDLETLTAEMSAALEAVNVRRKGGFSSFAEALTGAQDETERTQKAGGIIGVTTGLVDLDREIGGLEKGTLNVLAGRASMGKTALGQFLAVHAAEMGKNVAFFSLEMRSTQIAQRELSKRTHIPLDKLRRASLHENDWQAINQAANDLAALPLWIDAASGLSASSLRDRARKLARRVGGLGLIVVDYLQLVRPDDRYRGNKVAEVAEVSAALKALASDLEVPVLALAQLNREVEGRDDKRPRLSDLRWSGDLEQDADLVMLLYRAHYYQREAPIHDAKALDQWQQDKNVLEVIVAKQRQGATGTVRVFYEPSTSRFGNLGNV